MKTIHKRIETHECPHILWALVVEYLAERLKVKLRPSAAKAVKLCKVNNIDDIDSIHALVVSDQLKAEESYDILIHRLVVEISSKYLVGFPLAPFGTVRQIGRLLYPDLTYHGGEQRLFDEINEAIK